MNLFTRKRTAAILGCGPAGIFAAHALVEKGWTVHIFSKKRRSEMFGAQYLHKPIPGLTYGSPTTVHYKLVGTADGYRSKVYGRRSGITVSPEELDAIHSAWDIRTAYYEGWERYADLINNVSISPSWVHSLLRDSRYNQVISTLPAPALCEEGHTFDSQTVWAIGDAPERGIFSPVTEAKPFQVILNGSRDTGWYRNSNVFGYRTTEWPEDRRPPLPDLAAVEKPISTDCSCFPLVRRLGRYGKWQKGVLSHQAYEEANEL